jgi:hypothetical protein
MMLLVILLGGQYAPASGQGIGIEVGATRAGYDGALERPTGLGGYVDLPLDERIAIRFAVSHHTESRTINRSPCTGLVPPGTDCTDQRFDGDAHLTTYGVGFAVRLPSPGASLQPALYALGTGSDVDADFVARNSEARLQPVTPDGLSVGVAVGGSVRYAITPFWALSGRVGLHALRLGACGADAWFPFCERRLLPQLALGMRFGLSGLRE